MKINWLPNVAKINCILFLIALAVYLQCNIQAHANEATYLQNRLANHTIIYKDRVSRLSHSIYLSKLGNYDEFFPCEFTDGNWWLAKNGRLCLLDRIDDTRRNGFSCLKAKFNGNRLSFEDDTGEPAYLVKLVKGYALPFG